MESAKRTKLRNAKSFPMGQTSPKNSPGPEAPRYGRNGALPEAYGSTRVRTRDLTLLG